MAEKSSVARRPLIAIPARFSPNATALRYAAEVTARALVEAVFAAGGEPVVVHPYAPDLTIDVDAARERIWFADGVLLPGGGDVAARWSGQQPHPLSTGWMKSKMHLILPWRAPHSATTCRCWRSAAALRSSTSVNVALGGDLVQDMDDTVGNHRNRVHDLDVDETSPLGEIVGRRTAISCYHHQCIATLGAGLTPAAYSADGVIEAVTLQDHEGWYLGVQWHPEDSAATDPVQAEVFRHFVAAAALRAREASSSASVSAQS